jgi:hypothetical protein
MEENRLAIPVSTTSLIASSFGTTAFTIDVDRVVSGEELSPIVIDVLGSWIRGVERGVMPEEEGLMSADKCGGNAARRELSRAEGFISVASRLMKV